MRNKWTILFISVIFSIGLSADVCPTSVDPCDDIDEDRPRACSACIGVTINATNATYLYEGQSTSMACILHGLFSNNPSAAWYATYPNATTVEITDGVTDTTDTTDGTKTTYLSVTVEDYDVGYSCKYTASDGFSVQDTITHAVGDASSTIRCEISSDGTYFNKFWGYTDNTNIISSSDDGFTVANSGTWMNLTLDTSTTWTEEETYRCSASFVSGMGAYKSVTIKALHILEESIPAVLWSDTETTISISLASVNPSATSVKMEFGTQELTGTQSGEWYNSSAAMEFDTDDESIWTITATFQYPNETEKSITEHYYLYIADLQTPETFVCFAGESCDISITFNLSSIDGISSNGQICEFRTNGTDKKTVSWTYSDGQITASTTLTDLSYNDSHNWYTWTFALQNSTDLSLNITLDVAEIVAADLTVFDAYVTTVNYQFKLVNSDYTPTACYVNITATGEKQAGTLDGNICTVTEADVESQSEYNYTCVFEINNQTLSQKVSTDFIVLTASPSKPVVNVTGADVTMTCSALQYSVTPNVTWSCTGEWCEHSSKNLGDALNDTDEYTDLHTAQDACSAESECTGVTKEVRNGLTKYYLMDGSLTSSEEDDTSWVEGTCADDHSGWISIIDDCHESSCASSFELGVNELQVKYAASTDQNKYVNFFDADKNSIGFIKWSIDDDPIQVYQCSDAEELAWTTTPNSSNSSRTWTIGKNTTNIWIKLEGVEMFSYTFQDDDDGNCKTKYQKDIEYVAFNEFLTETTSPQYLNIGDDSQEIPTTEKNDTTAVSTYTKANLTRDTNCTCSFKFNDISTINRTITIYESTKLTPDSYYSLQQTVVEPACSFSIDYGDLNGTVEWYFEGEVIKNDSIVVEQYGTTSTYNISSSFGVEALDEESSALLTCKFLFTDNPSITWTVGVGLVEFHDNQLVFADNTESLEYNCSIEGSEEGTSWTYYRSFSGGNEVKLSDADWTEETWGLTDFTLKCRAELPSQNLSTYFVVDRAETLVTPTISEDEDYIQVWNEANHNMTVTLTDLTYTPTGFSYTCTDSNGTTFATSVTADDTSNSSSNSTATANTTVSADGVMSAPMSGLWRYGLWEDLDCTFTFIFKSSNVSVPFKVDVYGMVNITEVATADAAHSMSFSVYKLQDTSNVNISWNIDGSIDNKTDGYKSYVSTNSTGVTSRLEIESVSVDKHGEHNITVSSNGGDSLAIVKLYVIDVNRTPHSFVLQQENVSTDVTCSCINWKDNGTVEWNVDGDVSTKFTLSSIKSAYTADFSEDTDVDCKFSFPGQVSITRSFEIDVFAMANVSVEVIANVGSTATASFPISNLQNFSSVTTTWQTNNKTMTVPESFWEDISADCTANVCASEFSFEYISLKVKLDYDTSSTKKIHFFDSIGDLIGTMSWTNYTELTLSDYSSLDWTSDPSYNVNTTSIEWHITISNMTLTIESSTGTKYLEYDLQTDSACTESFCTKTTAKVSFEGMSELSASFYDLLIEDRHYLKRTATTANTGATFGLTIEDVVGDDRGSIPITVQGEDGQDHISYINVYAIEFDGGLEKNYTHKSGTDLTLTATIKGWLTQETSVLWYTAAEPDGASYDQVETTHGDSETVSELTFTFTSDVVVYCKFTFGDLTVTKTFTVDVFALANTTSLALVGDDVAFAFTIVGVDDDSTVDIYWKWNGLDGNVNELEESVSEYESITCGCTSSYTCACADDMDIVTYDVLVQQPTTVTNRTDDWRTVWFYNSNGSSVTYISWSDQSAKVKTKCEDDESSVSLPDAVNDTRVYKIDINSTHLVLYCDDEIIATDAAVECEPEITDYTSIEKVGFNSDLKDDAAKKMIKKDDRVHVAKTSYSDDTDTFNLQLNMDEVKSDDEGDVELTIVNEGGHNYTSYVNIIYTAISFDDVRIVSTNSTVPDAPLTCIASLEEAHAFTLAIQCNEVNGSVVATATVNSTTSHTLTYTVTNTTSTSCLKYKCELTISELTVSQTNNISILYNVSSEKWLVNEGWNGDLTTSAVYIGQDSNLDQACTWTATNKTYTSTFTKTGTAVSCSVSFADVTVADSAEITVTGFKLDDSTYVSTTAKLQVGTVTTSMEIGINEIVNPTVYCNVSGLDDSSTVTFTNTDSNLTTTYTDSSRSDKWEISSTFTENSYPVCSYTIDGYEGQLDGTNKLYVIEAELVSIAGLGFGAVGRITCNIHHDILDIEDESFVWVVNNEQVNGTNSSTMSIVSSYEAAKHNSHWYNASSTLFFLDVKKTSYSFHCFMAFHEEEFSHNENMTTISITPNHRNYDSAEDAVISYDVDQSCDSNYVINETAYDIFYSFTNVSSYHLSNAEINATTANNTTSIVTTLSNIDTNSTGSYYHLCGVNYNMTSSVGANATQVTEYLFLPFTINVIDLTTIGTYAQSANHKTALFFEVTNLDDAVDYVTITFNATSVVNVTEYANNQTYTTDGPDSSVISITKTSSTMLVYVTVPANQTVSSTVTSKFTIGSKSDNFTRVATLDDYYEYSTSDITYTPGETVNMTVALLKIPSAAATFALDNPFNARNTEFTVTAVYTATTETTSLGVPLYDCSVYVNHSSATLDMAGYYTLTVSIPAYQNYKTFDITTTIGMSIVETTDVNVTLIGESGTTALVELVDYSELESINVTGLTWSPSLPSSSFSVSNISESGRAHEATVTVTNVSTSDAGTYTFTFQLATGEEYSGKLVLSVIEKTVNTSSKEVCSAVDYTSTIYGSLHFPDTAAGATATVACAYNSMTVTDDVATRACVNGTWKSVNQTLCGSTLTSSLKTIYMSATSNVSSTNTSAFATQISFVTELKEYCATNISSFSGSDIEGVNTIIQTVTDGTFYNETATLIIDILDSVIENATSDAVSIYSLSSLSLRDTTAELGQAIFSNNTGTTTTYSGTKVAIVTTPAQFSANTSISTSVNGKSIEISMPDGNDLFSTTTSQGYIIALYADSSNVYQTESSASSVISPAVDIELSNSSKDTSNLTSPIVIEFDLNEKIPDWNGITAVYYDTSTSTWSTAGCLTNITSNYTVTAYCYHLSSFAIQYTSADYTEEVSIHQVTFAGVGVSIIFLVIALALLLPHKSLRGDQVIQSHIFLVVLMIVANLMLTVSVFVTHSGLGAGCDFIAFLANASWLAVHLWVMVEAIQLNTMINEGYTHRDNKQFLRFGCFAIGVGVFIALIGVIVMNVTDYYVNKARDICWLNGTSLLYFMWLPIVVFTLITLALLLKATVFLRKKEEKHEAQEVVVIKKTLLALLVLLTLLDVGWIFAGVAGATTLDTDLTTIQTYCNVVYTVFNIFQGIAVVVLFCILNPKVMDAWRGSKSPPVPDEEEGQEPTQEDIPLANLEAKEEIEEVEAPEVAIIDNSDARSKRSHKSAISLRSGRSRTAPRTVGQASAPAVESLREDAMEKSETKPKKKKKKAAAEDEGEEVPETAEKKPKKKKAKDPSGAQEDGEEVPETTEKKEKKPKKLLADFEEGDEPGEATAKKPKKVKKKEEPADFEADPDKEVEVASKKKKKKPAPQTEEGTENAGSAKPKPKKKPAPQAEEGTENAGSTKPKPKKKPAPQTEEGTENAGSAKPKPKKKKPKPGADET